MSDDLLARLGNLAEIADEFEPDPNRDAKLDCYCDECRRHYPGGDRAGGHCPTCHLSFRGNGGFDRHRSGRYDQGRRCLTEDELAAKGWSVSDDNNHVWRMPAPKTDVWANRKGEAL